MGRILILLQIVSIGIMLASIALGYGAAYGYLPVALHVPWGFGAALVIAFTHAMTIFYFVGMGVSMREATGGRRSLRAYLDSAEGMRRRLALPIGLALVTLMAAVILGGGSHTRWLPSWVHHVVSLAALACHLLAGWRALSLIPANEALIRSLQEALEGRHPPRTAQVG